MKAKGGERYPESIRRPFYPPLPFIKISAFRGCAHKGMATVLATQPPDFSPLPADIACISFADLNIQRGKNSLREMPSGVQRRGL